MYPLSVGETGRVRFPRLLWGHFLGNDAELVKESEHIVVPPGFGQLPVVELEYGNALEFDVFVRRFEIETSEWSIVRPGGYPLDGYLILTADKVLV